MPEENLPQEQEAEATPSTGSESEDALDSPFEDEDDSKSIEQRLERMEKGLAKFFSEQGRQKKEVAESPSTLVDSPVIQNLYFKANPEAELIWEDVVKEAKALNKDPYTLYESSAYFKGEAKQRAQAKVAEEEAKSKIAKPSNTTGEGPTDFSHIKSMDDFNRLSKDDKVAFSKWKIQQES
jgi:hypothetical protein